MKKRAPAGAVSGRTRGLGDAIRRPVGAGLILTVACYGLIASGRPGHRVGDFASHTLYISYIVLTAILLLWSGLRGHGGRHRLWWPPAVGAGTFACVEGLKRLTRLPRPDGDPTGFPSGHTTLAFALAWLLSATFPRFAPFWYGIAVVIGWSRVEGSAHFPYQVLVGAALGTLVGLAVSRGLRGVRAISPS